MHKSKPTLLSEEYPNSLRNLNHKNSTLHQRSVMWSDVCTPTHTGYVGLSYYPKSCFSFFTLRPKPILPVLTTRISQLPFLPQRHQPSFAQAVSLLTPFWHNAQLKNSTSNWQVSVLSWVPGSHW